MKTRKFQKKAIGLIFLFVFFSWGFNRMWIDKTKAGSKPAVFCIRHQRPARIIPSEIYGFAAATEPVLSELQVPLNRWGGNTASRYNWKLGNAWNTGRDWFFENVAVENRAWEQFMDRSYRSNSRVIISLPLVGYVAKDTTSVSFSIEKYGPQQKFDSYRPDAGNGVRPDGSLITGNDPLDACIAFGSSFLKEWIISMVDKYPDMFKENRVIFALGNEPMLWNIVHRDVHPQPTSYDDFFTKFKQTASVIKEIVPNAPVAGPELWGWPAYFQSAFDRENRGKKDRKSHGQMDFLPWFLKQLRTYEDQTGQRLLDYLTIHFYPQAQGVYSSHIDEKTRRLRVESTQSLFDATYRDPSWIKETIQLIPRLKNWVTEYYPGLKIGITEYNWGGEEDMSGAIALADILGIFGREGLDLACYWTYPPKGKPAYWAYAMYRNVDGSGKKFGDRILRVDGKDNMSPDGNISLYAALDEPAKVVSVIVVNKSTDEQKISIRFEGLRVRSGRWYFLVDPGLGISTAKGPVPVKGSKAALTLSPYSIHHLRFPVNQ